MSTTEDQRQPIDYGLMRRLFRFLHPYRQHIAGAVVLTLTASALGPLRPYLTRIAVDEHIVKGDMPGLLWFVSIILVVLVLQGALQYALTQVLTWIGQHVLHDIRTAL